MNDWPHDAIRAACLRYIRKHTERLQEWRFTCLDSLHPKLSSTATLGSKELPVVSCYINWSQWYVMSTGRVFGRYREAHFEVKPLEVTRWRWGDFKHHGRAEVEVAQLMLGTGTQVALAYETGPASMAPIYYERFWYVKYPILDKLAV